MYNQPQLLTYLVFVHFDLWFLHFVMLVLMFSLHMDIHMSWRVGIRKMGHNLYLMEKVNPALYGGIARTPLMLGHSTAIIRLHGLLREVWNHFGGAGGHVPPEVFNFKNNYYCSHMLAEGNSWLCTVAQCKSIRANSRLVGVDIAQFDFKTV